MKNEELKNVNNKIKNFREEKNKNEQIIAQVQTRADEIMSKMIDIEINYAYISRMNNNQNEELSKKISYSELKNNAQYNALYQEFQTLQGTLEDLKQIDEKFNIQIKNLSSKISNQTPEEFKNSNTKKIKTNANNFSDIDEQSILNLADIVELNSKAQQEVGDNYRMDLKKINEKYFSEEYFTEEPKFKKDDTKENKKKNVSFNDEVKYHVFEKDLEEKEEAVKKKLLSRTFSRN